MNTEHPAVSSTVRGVGCDSSWDRSHRSVASAVSVTMHRHCDTYCERCLFPLQRFTCYCSAMARRELFHLVDLCLLRSTDRLCLCVLPYGIRQLIKDFLGALDNASIRTAVNLWCENREEAIARYGHISLWDTHRVTDMNKLFYKQQSLSRLFYYQQSFNEDISGWDVSKVTTLSHMLYGAKAFNQPLKDWDVSAVTTMMVMFCCANIFNQPLSKWNVSSVTNMHLMFGFTRAFNQPLNDWDVSRVQSTYGMFCGTMAFNQPLNQWNLTAVRDIYQMFGDTSAFNQPLVSWNVASIAQKQDVFKDAVAYRQPETMAVWRAAGYAD